METRFLGIPPAGLAAMCAAVLALLVWYWRYLRAVKFPAPWLPVALRGAAMLSVVVLAANPAFYFDVKKPVPRRVAVMVDISQSMGISDPGAGAARVKLAADAAKKVLDSPGGNRAWGFTFSAHPEAVKRAGLEAAKPFGGATWLLSSVAEADTGEGLPISDVVAATDGRDNSGMTSSGAGPARARLHFLAVGARGKDVNVSAGDVQAPESAIAGQPLTIRGEVKMAGVPAGAAVALELTEAGKRLAGAKAVSRGKQLAGYRYTMTFVPSGPGLKTLTLRAVSPVREDTRRDNTRTVFVDVVSGKRKILLVDSPRWEATFLARRLSGMDKVETKMLLLTAGRAAGSESRRALTAGGLSQYRLVFAGAVAKNATGAEKSALLQYLRAGGSVVLLGGRDSLLEKGAGEWSGVARPVGGSVETEYPDPFSPRLTKSGRGSPFMRILPDAAGNEELWAGLPYVYTFNAINGPPGMDVLARHPWAECGNGKCALAGYARVGRGRLFIIAFEGLWRWELARRPTGAFENLLENIAAPLLEPEETRPVRVSLRKRNYTLGDEVCFEASVDGGGKPSAVITGPGGETAARPALTKRAGGFFTGCYVPQSEGVYKVRVSAGGAASGDEPFAVEVARDEFLLTSANLALMEAEAKRTGGSVYEVKDAGKLAAELARPGQWRTERIEAELWHRPYCWYALGFIVLLLSAEWFARRRGGLT